MLRLETLHLRFVKAFTCVLLTIALSVVVMRSLSNNGFLDIELDQSLPLAQRVQGISKQEFNQTVQFSTSTNDAHTARTHSHNVSQEPAMQNLSQRTFKKDSSLSSVDEYPLLWDTSRFEKHHTTLAQQRFAWPCSKPYQGPRVDTNVKIYVYEPPRKMQKELQDYIDYRHSKNQWTSDWDYEGPLFQLFRNSSMRTYDPNQASFFVVPLKIGTLGFVKTATESLKGLRKWLDSVGPYWKRNHGADHIVTSFLCNRKFLVLSMLRPNCGPIIACITAKASPGFDAMIIPYYVKEEQFQLKVSSDLETRHISVYFAGSLIATQKSLRLGYPGWAPPRKPIVDAIRDVPGSRAFVFHRSVWDPIVLRKLVKEINYNMSRSVFTLIPHGDSAESARIFQAIAVGSVPLFTTGRIVTVLPFAEILDWSKFSVLIDLDDVLLYRHHHINKHSNLSYENTKQLREKVLARFVSELAAVSPSHKQILLKNVAQVRQAFRFGPGYCELDRLIASSLTLRAKVF